MAMVCMASIALTVSTLFRLIWASNGNRKRVSLTCITKSANCSHAASAPVFDREEGVARVTLDSKAQGGYGSRGIHL